MSRDTPADHEDRCRAPAATSGARRCGRAGDTGAGRRRINMGESLRLAAGPRIGARDAALYPAI